MEKDYAVPFISKTHRALLLTFVGAEQTNNALRNSPLVVQYLLESGTLDHNDSAYGLGATTVGPLSSDSVLIS